MSEKITRREFFKLVSYSAASLAIEAGFKKQVGDIAGWQGFTGNVLENPGELSAIATTCSQCPAGCGILVSTASGNGFQINGNVNHPLNRGGLCPKAETAVDELFAPQRVKGPVWQVRRGSGEYRPLTWDQAIPVISGSLRSAEPGDTAFLLGTFPDHLYDLVKMMATELGGLDVYRFGLATELEGSTTLLDASRKKFGFSKIPFYDIHRADVIYFFGADFNESWITPLMYANQQSNEKPYKVLFSAYRPPEILNLDDWVGVPPGSEGRVIAALSLALDDLSTTGRVKASTLDDIHRMIGNTHLSAQKLVNLARRFVQSQRSLAVPGGLWMGNTNGLEIAEAILDFNIQAGNMGAPGELYTTPGSPQSFGFVGRSNTAAEMGALIERMRAGKIKTLFIHGVDPLGELPASSGFEGAIKGVDNVISFASTWNKTGKVVDFIFPDHLALESWGYQRVNTGCDRPAVSSIQPAATPRYETRSSAEALLAAWRALDKDQLGCINCEDEIAFIRGALQGLKDKGGVYQTSDESTFWEYWKNTGGWWLESPALIPGVSLSKDNKLTHLHSERQGGEKKDGQLRVLWLMNLLAEDGKQVRERQYSPTTHMAYMHPDSVRENGVNDGDSLLLISKKGEIIVKVIESVDVLPGIIAIPIERANPVYRSDCRVNQNTLILMGFEQNASGMLARDGTWARVEKIL